MIFTSEFTWISGNRTTFSLFYVRIYYTKCELPSKKLLNAAYAINKRENGEISIACVSANFDWEIGGKFIHLTTGNSYNIRDGVTEYERFVFTGDRRGFGLRVGISIVGIQGAIIFGAHDQ